MKRYRDYNSYLREIFGERVQKISLDAGFSCPNRDGTISRKGCIYCDNRGSGSGAMIDHGISIEEQIREGRRFAATKYKAKKFIAYFQSFTNTYAPASRLKDIYDLALKHEGMVGLSVGTRPDCLDDETMNLLASYSKDYLVWVELGLQTAHDETLRTINRGHDSTCFEKSVRLLHDHELNVCAHVILGLPGETQEMMLETARFVAGLPIEGIKIHMLYIVKGTLLANLYKKGEYQCLEREEYVEILVDFLELLPPDVVIQRLTGDPVKAELVAPVWAGDKAGTLNLINDCLERRDTWQGKLWQKRSSAGK